MGLYPSIPHDVGLKALNKQALDKREQKKILREDLLDMAEDVLESNFFDFNSNIKQEISRTAIGTKCAPTYACISIVELERTFLQTQDYQPFLDIRKEILRKTLWKRNHGSFKEVALEVWQRKNWERSNFLIKLATSNKKKKVSPFLLHITRF